MSKLRRLFAEPRTRLAWTLLWIVIFAGGVAGYVVSAGRGVRDILRATEDPAASQPLSVDQRFQVALKAWEAGRLVEAADHLAALRQSAGHDPRVRLLEGGILLRQGRLAEASERLSPLVATAGEFQARALAMLGEALMKAQRFREAEPILIRAAILDPDLVDPHRWLAIYYHDIGAMEAAIQHLRMVVKLSPTDPRPFRLMGRINKEYERFPLAVENYEAFLRLDPVHEDREAVLLELATSHVRLRQYAEALKVLARASESPEALAIEAECLRTLGKVDEAQKKLQRALTLDPDHLLARLRAGEMAIADDDLVLAEQHFRHAVDKHPFDDAAKYQLGIILRRTGKTEEAEQLIQRSQQLKQKREHLFELHLQAIERPTDADLRVQIAEQLMEFELFETARQWLRAALTLEPQHEKARELERLTAGDGVSG